MKLIYKERTDILKQISQMADQAKVEGREIQVMMLDEGEWREFRSEFEKYSVGVPWALAIWWEDMLVVKRG